MIYLDNNSGNKMLGAAIKDASATMFYLEAAPGPAHRASKEANHALSQWRSKTASLLGKDAKNGDLVFTSGIAENAAIMCSTVTRALPEKGVLSSIADHSSITSLRLLAEHFHGWMRYYPITPKGTPDLDKFEEMLDPFAGLVYISLVNAETGVISPVAEMASIVKERCSALVFVDAHHGRSD